MKRSILLLTTVLTFVGCDFFRPLDGPGMERTDDGLDSIAVANARRAVESFETKQYRLPNVAIPHFYSLRQRRI